MHEENYDQKVSKPKKKVFQKNSKSNDFWICFFAVKRHLVWTYWWKVYEWSLKHLNNHWENAWRKLWSKSFKTKKKLFQKKF